MFVLVPISADHNDNHPIIEPLQIFGLTHVEASLRDGLIMYDVKDAYGKYLSFATLGR